MKNGICSMIRDLLPNYMENLTSKTTNKIVEDHLEKCDECKKEYMSMKENINIKGIENSKQELNFLGKYAKRMNILKGIIITICVIIILFSINYFYKYSIINKISNKNIEYQSSENFYIKSVSTNGNENIIQEFWYLNGKYKEKVSSNSEIKWVNYGEIGKNQISFVDKEKKAYKTLNPSINYKEDIFSIVPNEITSLIDKKVRIIMPIVLSIKKENDTYKLEYENKKVVINKENLFPITDSIKNGNSNSVVTYEININQVNESDISTPSLEGYEIIEK